MLRKEGTKLARIFMPTQKEETKKSLLMHEIYMGELNF